MCIDKWDLKVGRSVVRRVLDLCRLERPIAFLPYSVYLLSVYPPSFSAGSESACASFVIDNAVPYLFAISPIEGSSQRPVAITDVV